MKKILAMLLSVMLLLGIAMPAASAAGDPTVTLSSGQVAAGGSVKLTVSIKDNPGLANSMLYLYYNTDVFTVDLRTGVKAAGDFARTGAVLANSIAVARENGRYDGKAGKEGVLALWYNGTGVDTDSNGDMLTVTFKVKADAVNGAYPVVLDYSKANTANDKSQRIALKTVSGTITVTGGKEGTPDTGDVGAAGTYFTDTAGHWAETYIDQAAALKLINGYEDGTYRPDKTMTRAECVTILWRASGSPKPKKTASFTDLDPKQSWYWDAVSWAAENGVVEGVGEGRFNPKGNVTRAQLATILHRMAGTPVGMELMVGGVYDSTYSDSAKVASWAKNGIYWAVYKGIYCGEDSASVGTALVPNAPADRGQIAVMIVRYLEKYEGGALG